MSKKLTPMMQLFALEYIVDFNGKEAAIRAGYKPNYAGQQAHRLLNDDRILAAIDEAITARKKRLYITQDTVLLKWWQIANADYNELSSVRRTACDMCHFTVETEGDETIDRTINPDCRNCEGEGVPYVFIGDTEKLSAEGKLIYQGAKQTKFGLEVQTVDRMKALDNVARHLGMFKDTVNHVSEDGSMTPVTNNFNGDAQAASQAYQDIMGGK
jgi:phage terminase small subunit